jgi:DNA polymerase-3 subunit alpha/error-prone DNA polymerase
MVSAQQTFGRRAAYREGLKALGLSLGEVNRFCAQIPEDPDEERSAKSPLELLPERYRAAAPLLERLIGRPQHLSVHPGGVVLAEPRVECYAPLQRAPKGVPVTQYDMTSLERLGLIKLDLLGNRALSAIQEALRWIAVREPGSRAAREPGIPLPDGDPTTLDLLHAGNTVGCFQIETPALRSLLRKVPVRGVDDLIATLALVRPGPASGEAKAAYIRRAHGQEPPEPPHPALTGLLRPSYGILLYEEDLMAAIARLTGCSLSRADQIRAELIRSEPGSAERAELEGGFVAAALAAGVSRTEATEVWQILERFAAYSFSKAHAASYAQLAWQAAYLKAHFPLELACGVLNSYGGQYPLRTVAAEFARSGVRLLGPHVNHSESRHSVQAGAVRLGLESVKYLTALSRERIRSSRPFADLAELLGKVPLQARELEALVLGGACDDLEPLRTAGYPFAHEDFLSQWQQNPDLRALSGWQFRRPAGEHAAIHAALVRIRNELRFLGMHPSAHPMRVLRNEAARAGCITTAELASHAGREVHLAGLVAATRRLPVSGGRTLQFVTLEDEHGLVEAVRRPGGSAVPGDPITNPGPFLLSGRVETDHGDRQLVISKVTPFHLRTSPYGAPATV